MYKIIQSSTGESPSIYGGSFSEINQQQRKIDESANMEELIATSKILGGWSLAGSWTYAIAEKSIGGMILSGYYTRAYVTGKDEIGDGGVWLTSQVLGEGLHSEVIGRVGTGIVLGIGASKIDAGLNNLLLKHGDLYGSLPQNGISNYNSTSLIGNSNNNLPVKSPFDYVYNMSSNSEYTINGITATGQTWNNFLNYQLSNMYGYGSQAGSSALSTIGSTSTIAGNTTSSIASAITGGVSASSQLQIGWSGVNLNGASVIVDGSHIMNNQLGKDITYITGEYNYYYTTDNLRRIVEVQVPKLNFTERSTRASYNSNSPGKLTGDHAGLLVADRFGGSGELDNIVSQIGNSVNQSSYKKIENTLAEAIKSGKTPSLNINVNYVGNSSRPSSFEVIYKIDGGIEVVKIKN